MTVESLMVHRLHPLQRLASAMDCVIAAVKLTALAPMALAREPVTIATIMPITRPSVPPLLLLLPMPPPHQLIS